MQITTKVHMFKVDEKKSGKKSFKIFYLWNIDTMNTNCRV